ncbi:MAG: ATP-binding protein [Candidatus Pacebacteria bacterium]|nr:ATP-binding protein [Candidatus Paceibacterota bacterium]
MNSFIVSSFLTAILSIMLGSFIFLQDPKNRTNRMWSFTTFAVFLNWLGLGFICISTTADQAFFWQKILYVGTIFIPVFFFHFCNSFLNRTDKVKKLLTLGYLLSFAFLALLFTNLLISGVTGVTDIHYWPVETGILYYLFLVYYAFYVVYTVVLLKTSHKKTTGILQNQIDYIYYAALIGFVGGSTNFLLDFNFNSLPIGNYFMIFYIVFITYAILKHRLFNLKVIVTELLTFSIWVFLLIRALLATNVKDQIVDWSLLAILVVSGIFLVRSVIKEVTQREKIEKLAKDLETANVRLTELDRQKSEFVSFATHQLRAPLTAMKGYASMILDGDMGTLSAEAKLGVSRIFDSAKTLTNIVDDYLNITRIELGTMKYAFETIDWKVLIQDILGELKPNIEKSKLTFSFKVQDEAMDYRITADRDKFKQVIANLIDNSMKYTPTGSVDLSLSFDRARRKFVFMIKDTGIGIAPEVLPHLFAKWSRAGNANKTNIKGTGLGLFVAKEIITAHHGEVRAESVGEGKGSTFIVEMEPFGKM